MQKQFSQLFPSLKISGLLSSLWCETKKVNGHIVGGSAIDEFKIPDFFKEGAIENVINGKDTNSLLYQELKRIETESKKVLESNGDFFFCSRCNATYSVEHYKAFYHTGQFCKNCYNADPKLQKEIVNENYR